MRWARNEEVDILFDVGANIGQFAKECRAKGFDGLIYSFEPIISTHRILVRNFTGDKNWHGFQIALSDEIGTGVMGVSANSGLSSSFLLPTSLHLENFPEVNYSREELVLKETLDYFIQRKNLDFHNGFLKLDVQGYEEKVLRGVSNNLSRFKFIQVECSISPMYSNEHTIQSILDLLHNSGFKIIDFENGVRSRDGYLLQMDLLFIRNPAGK